jgi:23S rRNA pseudouridine1911/1915/1917 synthase
VTLRTFSSKESGARLDTFLADLCGDLSRTRIKRLIVDGEVTVDGQSSNAGYRLKPGQHVEIRVPEPVPSHMLAQDIPISVVFEDDHIIVVDKPAGLPVHPGPGHPDSTLVNGLLGMRPSVSGVGGVMRPGLVHRLDMDTSGLMVVAKTDAAHATLSANLKNRMFDKGYTGLVMGILAPREALIDAPIGRDPTNRKRMALDDSGRASQTAYSAIKIYENKTLADVKLLTGRTHQVRVHFASIGHPIVGDETYGRTDPDLDRHFLHAYKLGFEHPETGEDLEFHAPLPPELQKYLDNLE